jgi:glycosyltransferase involved in cell wall biosynthesis
MNRPKRVHVVSHRTDGIYHGYSVYTLRLIAALRQSGHTVVSHYYDDLPFQQDVVEQVAPHEAVPKDFTPLLGKNGEVAWDEALIFNLPVWSVVPPGLYPGDSRVVYVLHDIIFWCPAHGSDRSLTPCAKHEAKGACFQCNEYQGPFIRQALELRASSWSKHLAAVDADRLIVPSAFMGDFLRRRGIKSRHVEHFSLTKGGREAVKREGGRKRILVVGFGYKVNSFVLCRLIDRLTAVYPGKFTFVINSYSDDAFKLRSAFPATVELAPAVNPLTPLAMFDGVDVTLNLSTKAESYGMAVAESLGCNVPVVTSNSGALVEFSGYDGCTVVDVDDTSAVERAIHAACFGQEPRIPCQAPGVSQQQYVEDLIAGAYSKEEDNAV